MAEEDVVHKKVVASELGITGLKRQSGLIYEEFLPQLQGQRAVSVFQEMSMNDAVSGASLQALKLNMRSAKWHVEPGTASRKDKDYAKFVDESRNDMNVSWGDLVDEIMSMLEFGWSYHETVYKQRGGIWAPSASQRSQFSDGYVSWRKIPIRSQNSLLRWLFDDKGGIDGMIQLAPPDYDMVAIPIDRALLFRTTSAKNNPEGKSVFRNAYRSWYFKKMIEEIEGIGVERDLAGLPMAYVDPAILFDSATDDEKALLQMVVDLVKKVRRDQAEGVVFPRSYDKDGHQLFDFSLLSSGGTRQFSTNEIITRYNQLQAMVTLTDFLMLGNTGTGSYALSNDKTSLFTRAIGTFLDQVADVFNRHAIPRLFKLNGWQPDRLPRLVHEDIDMPDLGALGAYLTSLAGIGVPLMPDEELENFLRTAAHLPPKSPDAVRQQADAQAQQQAQQYYSDQQQAQQSSDQGPNAQPPPGTPPENQPGGGGWGGKTPAGMAGPYPPGA